MDLFQEWLLEKYLGLTVSKEQEQLLETAKKLLVDNALEQPQVFVHRDYHSRNLMVLPDGETGVLDFQDAVKGPLTYDLVSLLRDCYARLPIFDRRQMMEYFRQRVLKRIDRPMMKAQFSLWFDRMGVQRHLKAAGIFARLSVRDGKHQFLEDISTTLVYIIEATADERALSPLGDFIAEEVLPALEEKRLG